MLRSMNHRITLIKKKDIVDEEQEEEEYAKPDFKVNPAYTELVSLTMRRSIGKALLQRKRTLKTEEDEVKIYETKMKNSQNYSIYGITNPVPEPELKDKFKYFYKAYNYNANTKRYITYDSTEVPEIKAKSSTHLTDYCEMVKKHNERELARKEYERQEQQKKRKRDNSSELKKESEHH